VCDQLASKISSELSSHLPGYSGKLSAETLSKSEYEITQTTEQVLTGTTSHLVQQVEGQELTFQLTAENDDRVAQLRRRYFPFRWDVYLHSFEYLELTYGRKVPRLWKQVRETIKQSSDVLGWPLISVTFYEPQVDPNVFLTPVPDALGDPDAILISELNDTMPRSTLPDRESLNELAKLAFPVTKEEKSRAVGRPRKRAAMKRAAPKRAAKKRAAPKRAAKKRAAKKK